jgi:hypothetical protein
VARRKINVFSLSFLDAMTCGFGAVVLFFMVINAAVGVRAERQTGEMQGEVDKLERQVLDQYQKLVELRAELRDVTDESRIAASSARRIQENIETIQRELAGKKATSIERRELIDRLKRELQLLDEETRSLSAVAVEPDETGNRMRDFVGDGDRQYLTGLKVGGKRIFILIDASASMLDDQIVNIVRLRNMAEDVRIRAAKWQQAVRTVDWLVTQVPADSQFQLYTFAEEAGPAVADSAGNWLDGSQPKTLDEAVDALKQIAPEGGTNLWAGIRAIKAMRPRPDNVILVTDGLPTQGSDGPRGRTVTGKRRLRLMNEALNEMPAGIPVNIVLLPMEGDPMAPSAFWKVAIASGGSFISPSEDWP